MTAPQNRPTIKPKAAPRPPAAPPPIVEAGPDPYAPARATVTLPLPPGLTVPTQPQVGVDTLELLARVAALEAKSSGGLTEPTPQPQAPRAVADPATLTPFQAELVARTNPTPVDYQASGVTYNHANRFFARPDGLVVELQGGPPAIAYYVQKGYHLLSAEETERWLKVERPVVVRAQLRKAQLINANRRVIKLNPQIEGGLPADWDEDQSRMTIAELEEQNLMLNQMSGQARVSLPRPPRLVDNETAEVDRQLIGIDTAANVSKEDLDRQLASQPLSMPRARGQGRMVEMTPSDRY